jgi:hypothetical protein
MVKALLTEIMAQLGHLSQILWDRSGRNKHAGSGQNGFNNVRFGPLAGH